jgi:hypothetical protein
LSSIGTASVRSGFGTFASVVRIRSAALAIVVSMAYLEEGS